MDNLETDDALAEERLAWERDQILQPREALARKQVSGIFEPQRRLLMQLTIEDEQLAFDAALPLLVAEHPGEYALFHGGVGYGFYETRADAYREALAAFGLDEVFLISEVKPKEVETTSLSWELGVMFGQEWRLDHG